jgi:hypothetical protein
MLALPAAGRQRRAVGVHPQLPQGRSDKASSCTSLEHRSFGRVNPSAGTEAAGSVNPLKEELQRRLAASGKA